MRSILSLLLFGSLSLGVFGGDFQYLNDTMSATHTTVKALITEDRVICKQQGLCPMKIPSSTQAELPCVGGFVSLNGQNYPCSGANLLSFISLADLGCSNCDGNDIWGWTDPETDRKYVIAGTTRGSSIVDVTDPINPVVLVWLTSVVSTATIWRDMKVLNNYVYIVADRSGQYMQYWDLTQLRSISSFTTITPPFWRYTMGTGNTHNIVINPHPNGEQLAYLVGNNGCSGGLYAVDISDPGNPTFKACFASDGYTHDAECVTYHGPDADYVGHEICFAYNENTLTIVDFTDAEPVMLARMSYTGVAYSHQGWIDETHRWLFLDDELDESRQTTGYQGSIRTYCWDVRELTAPRVSRVYQHAQTGGIDHNMYIRGRYIYQANYELGLRVLGFAPNPITGVPVVEEVAYFDTYPEGNRVAFNGAWSNYPYFEYAQYEDNSVVVAVQDINRGLFMVRVTNVDAELAKSKNQYYHDLAMQKLNATKKA
jgi:choice-of-anchor B domain-containing protein